jgi:hypothetical protein
VNHKCECPGMKSFLASVAEVSSPMKDVVFTDVETGSREPERCVESQLCLGLLYQRYLRGQREIGRLRIKDITGILNIFGSQAPSRANRADTYKHLVSVLSTYMEENRSGRCKVCVEKQSSALCHSMEA